MKKLPLLLMLVALLPARMFAFDNTYYRSLAAMPLAVDACSRAGLPAGLTDDQLGRFVARLNDANVTPPLFVETVRYAPIALQQPDFFPFVDNEISQGVTGAALVTVINDRLPRYGVTVRHIETTPSLVLSDNYIPRYDSYSSRSNVREVYSARYRHPRYDRQSMEFLIEMPLAVATVSDLDGIRQDDLGHFCGALNRGYLPPEQFVDTVRYAPAVFVERPDFVPFIEAQIGNGVIGIQLYDSIYPRLPSYSTRSIAFTPDYVLNDQYYIPQPVRTRFEQAQVNGGYPQQAYAQTYVPQPAVAQPVYTPQPVYTQQPVVQPSYAQQRGNRGRQPRAIAQPSFVPQPTLARNPYTAMTRNPNVAPQVAHIPPGQARNAERQAVRVVRQQEHGNGHAHGHGQVVQQQPIIAPPPMASAVPRMAKQEHGNGHARGRGQAVRQQPIVAPPSMASAVPAPAPAAPVFVPPPAQNNGHGHGQGGQGTPGHQKEKGGKGHGKD
jgi:hypothetical protein